MLKDELYVICTYFWTTAAILRQLPFCWLLPLRQLSASLLLLVSRLHRIPHLTSDKPRAGRVSKLS